MRQKYWTQTIFISLEFADEFLSKSPTVQKYCLNQLIDQGLHLQQSKDDIVQFIDKVLQHSLDTSDTERVLDKCRDIDKELYVKLVCTTFAEQRYSEIGEVRYLFWEGRRGL